MTIDVDGILLAHGITRAQVRAAAPQSGEMLRAFAEMLEHTAEQQPRELSAAERFDRARAELNALSVWLRADGNAVAARAVDGAASLLARIASWCAEGAA